MVQGLDQVQGLDPQQRPSQAALAPSSADHRLQPAPPALTPAAHDQQHGYGGDGNDMSSQGSVAEFVSSAGDAGDSGPNESSSRSDRSGPSGSVSGSGSGFGSKSNTSLELTPASSLGDDDFFPLTINNVALAADGIAIQGTDLDVPTPVIAQVIEKGIEALRIANESLVRQEIPVLSSRPSYSFTGKSSKNRLALDSIISDSPLKLPQSVPEKRARDGKPSPPKPAIATHTWAHPPGSPTSSGTSGWSGSSAKAAEAKDILSPLPTSTTSASSIRAPARPPFGRLASVPIPPTILETEILPLSPTSLSDVGVQTPGPSSMLHSPYGYEDDDQKSRSSASEGSRSRGATSARRSLANSPFRSYHGQLPSTSSGKASSSRFLTMQGKMTNDRFGHRRSTSVDQESLLSEGRTPQVDSPDLLFRQPFFHNFQSSNDTPLSTVDAAPATSPNFPEGRTVGSPGSSVSAVPRVRNSGILAPHGSFTTVKLKRPSTVPRNDTVIAPKRRARSDSSGGSSAYKTPRNGSVSSPQGAEPADERSSSKSFGIDDLAAVAAAAGDQIALHELSRERGQEGSTPFHTSSSSHYQDVTWGFSESPRNIRRASNGSASSQHTIPNLGPTVSSQPHLTEGLVRSGDTVETSHRGALRLGLGISTIPRVRQSATNSDLFMDAAMLASRQSALESARANRVERQRRESDPVSTPPASRQSASGSKSKDKFQASSASRHTGETDEERLERRRRRRDRRERHERRERRANERAEHETRRGVMEWAGSVADHPDGAKQSPVRLPYPPASLDDSLESVEEIEREEQERRDRDRDRRRNVGQKKSQ